MSSSARENISLPVGKNDIGVNNRFSNKVIIVFGFKAVSSLVAASRHVCILVRCVINTSHCQTVSDDIIHIRM
jgi:hypothetical protein